MRVCLTSVIRLPVLLGVIYSPDRSRRRRYLTKSRVGLRKCKVRCWVVASGPKLGLASNEMDTPACGTLVDNGVWLATRRLLPPVRFRPPVGPMILSLWDASSVLLYHSNVQGKAGPRS